MSHQIARTAFLLFLLSSSHAWAAEPLLGTWKLTSQVVGGQKTDFDPLILRIYKSGDALEFAYSVPVNGIFFVSTTFSSVHLDGSESDVRDARGKKVGTVKVTKAGSSEYQAIIQGPNRPTARSKLTISADGRTLTSESGGGSTSAVQVFSRQ
jgi:hypothetical protein